MTTISIIGTAGGEKELSSDLYKAMISKTQELISKYPDPHLVSGGAAWADHVAVAIHKMKGYPLTLHLPCKWDLEKKAFHDTGKNDWKSNPGGTANFYHHKFSKTMDREESYSLESIDALIREKKITTSTSRGFHARNHKVAGSNVVIAFTWGETCPPPGGTAHTWSLVKGERIHICLSNLE